jgi:hypothetical protein
MGADPSPDDVDVALPHGIAVVEGGSAVWRPSHLENSWSALHSPNSKARSKAFPTFQVLDELGYGLPESFLVLLGQLSEVPRESRELREGRHCRCLTPSVRIEVGGSYHATI